MDTWILPALIALPLIGAAGCILCRRKPSPPRFTEKPKVAPMPKGFRFLDEARRPGEAASAEPPEEPDVLELPGDGPEALGVACTSGNPGLAYSSADFARCLQEELAESYGGRKATIYVIGLANFSTRREYLGAPLGMQQEARCVKRALARVAARHRESGLVLLAHSLSSSLLLQYLLEALEEGAGCLAGVRVPRVIWLMPFLEFNCESREQIIMRFLLRQSLAQPFIRWLARFYTGLPVDSLEWLMRNVVGAATDEDVEVLLATSGTLKHILPGQLFLGSDAFRQLEVGSPTNGFKLMADLLRQERRPELRAFYCEGHDEYAPCGHMERLAAMFADSVGRGGPSAEVGLLGIVHNFVQFAHACRKAAKTLAPVIAEAWRQAPCCAPLPSRSSGMAKD